MPADRDLLDRLTGSPARPPGHLGPESALAIDPLDTEAWRALGRACWERAVSQRDTALRQRGEACLDLARVLSIPWPSGPPDADFERLQWARLGRPVRAGEWTSGQADGPRRAALAFLAGDVAGFAAAYSMHRPTLARAEAIWIDLAVTDALGDREERARRLEQMRAAPPSDLLPAWLAQWHGGEFREPLLPAVAALRSALRGRGAAAAAAARAGWFEACRHTAMARVAARQALLERPSRRPAAEAALLRSCVALAARTGDLDLALMVQPRLTGLPLALAELLRLPLEPADGTARYEMALRTLRQQVARLPEHGDAEWHRTAAEAIDPVAHPAAATTLLLAVRVAARRRHGLRREVSLKVLDHAHAIEEEALPGLLEAALGGWTRADDHDELRLAAIDLLLCRGDWASRELARHHAARLDRAVARSTASLRLAAAYAGDDRGTAERLADDCLRRLRPERRPVELVWALRIEAARLLCALGAADGPSYLLDAAAQLSRPWPGPAARTPRLLLARALAEAGLPAWRAASHHHGRLARWLARAYAGSIGARPPRPLPACCGLELRLAAATGARKLLLAAELLPAAAPDSRAGRTERLMAVVRGAEPREAVALHAQAVATRSPVDVLLAAEALESIADRRGQAAAASAAERVWREVDRRLAAAR